MAGVISTLQELLVAKPENESIAGPNPFTGDIEITFKETPGTLKVMIYTLSGQIVVNKAYQEYISRTLLITDLENRQQGVYIIKLVTSNGTYNHKVIKINN